MILVNENFGKLQASYLFSEIAKRVKAYQTANPDAAVIRLGIGDVTLPLAPACREAMHKAVDELGEEATFRGYGPEQGYDFLREAIAVNDYQSRGCDIKASEIFVSDGSKCDCANIQELFAQELKIAIPDPVYPVYVDTNVMAGRTGDAAEGRYQGLYYLESTAENAFVPAPPSERVDLIYLCFPNNPTGAALSKKELQRYVDWALQNGSLIIYDAAYSAFIHSPDIPHSIYECEGAKGCAIECGSFSKLAGFTGVRCGYTVVPRELLGGTLNDMWKRRLSAKHNGVSYPVQRAAEAVLTADGKRECKENIAYYMNNARMIRDGLQAAGLTVYGGVDAPYVWMRTPHNMSGWDFLDLLLDKAQVAGMPGEGFGPAARGISA